MEEGAPLGVVGGTEFQSHGDVRRHVDGGEGADHDVAHGRRSSSGGGAGDFRGHQQIGYVEEAQPREGGARGGGEGRRLQEAAPGGGRAWGKSHVRARVRAAEAEGRGALGRLGKGPDS